MSGVMRSPWRAVDPRRLELGEGARTTPGGFAFVDLLAGAAHATTGEPGSGMTTLLTRDEPLGAIAPGLEEGSLIAAVGTGVELVAPDGTRRWLGRPAHDASPALRVNDAVVDPHGRFWVGFMPYQGQQGAGFLIRVDHDGSQHRVIEDLTIPNGPAFSPDGTLMYLADTPTGRVDVRQLDPATGVLGPARPHLQIDEGSPDGMAVDAEGCLWVAVWGAACVQRFAPSGELLERIAVPASQPTSIALTTDRPHRALVTTALHGIAEPHEHDGRVLVAEVAVAGLPQPRFGAVRGPSGA